MSRRCKSQADSKALRCYLDPALGLLCKRKAELERSIEDLENLWRTSPLTERQIEAAQELFQRGQSASFGFLLQQNALWLALVNATRTEKESRKRLNADKAVEKALKCYEAVAALLTDVSANDERSILTYGLGQLKKAIQTAR